VRLFQNAGIYPAYLPRLASLHRNANSFAEMRAVFLADRFGACHILLPVLEGDPSAFFTNGDHEPTQRRWAQENGLPRKSAREDILFAQIEHHRTEVFYNLDPMRFTSAFVRRLPGCVRYSIAWRAAPSPGADFSAFDLTVCNFPGILKSYTARGWRAAYFSPAHDPAMDTYADNSDRPIDVLFVGGYTRHHRARSAVLEAVAELRHSRRVVFHLDRARATRWAESRLGSLLPLANHRRPRSIRAVSAEPVFGLDLYSALSRAKVVLNGAVDMAGEDRGNMRCFEAMGCGAVMVSDAGRYPTGMDAGRTFHAYRDPSEAVSVIEHALVHTSDSEAMRQEAKTLMRTAYNKAGQWQSFQRLVASLS
jgi:hypothetical protein